MNCPKCSYKLTLLFTSTACDKCDGLLAQPQSVLRPGSRVRFVHYSEHTEFVGVIDSQHSYDTWNVIWDHAPASPTKNTSDELVLI